MAVGYVSLELRRAIRREKFGSYKYRGIAETMGVILQESTYEKQGLPFIAVHGLFIAVAFPIVMHRLQECGLQCCSMGAH